MSFLKGQVLALAVALIFSSLARHSAAIEPQQTPVWCWASAVQDVVYSRTGTYVPQADVAARLGNGYPAYRAASPMEVAALLQSYGVSAGVGGSAWPQQLASTLTWGGKVIALVDPTGGPMGHFVVLEGILPNGALVIADPSSGYTQAFPMQSLYSWNWLASVVIQ